LATAVRAAAVTGEPIDAALVASVLAQSPIRRSVGGTDQI
jgi:hypothetical protein